MNKTTTLLLCIAAITVQSCKNAPNILVEIENPTLPILVEKEVNPVMRLDLIRVGSESYRLTEVELDLRGTTNITDITSVDFYEAKSDGSINPNAFLATASIENAKALFSNDLSIDKDTFTVWISAKLSMDADIQHYLQISCVSIQTDKGKLELPTVTPKQLRFGKAVRQHMQDDVHTFRIPGLATSKQGTLLAIFDARYESARDLQGHIDIGLTRSVDGGYTWQPMQVVLDMKTWGNLPEKYNGVSDACILVDDNTGDIYVAGLWMHGVLDGETGKWVEGLTQDSTRWIHQWQSKGSQPGFGVKQTSQFLITKSTDDGLTWSEPVNITKIKNQDWWLFAPAPGHGITLKDGTLVMPSQGRDKEGLPFSNITWSKDQGKTWNTSEPAYNNTTECMAVELEDGGIMLNMRDNRNRGNEENNGRRICVTYDLGKPGPSILPHEMH